MKLSVVRAGPPDFQGRVVGAFEVPLSPEGRERARAAAGAIQLQGEVAAIYHPPAGHAAEAGALIAKVLGARVERPLADLAELDLGLWQGLTEEELVQRHAQAFAAFRLDARAVVPPEAEELDEARDRVGRALARMKKAHRREEDVVVAVVGELGFALLVAAVEGKEAPRDLWRARSSGEDVRTFALD